jgi:hypothetical protein
MTDEQPNPEDATPDAPEAPENVTDTPAEDPDGFDAEKAREKIRKVNSEAAALRKRLQEAETKAQGADDKDKTITTQEAEIMRLRVAVKHGLPESLVKRLSGSTEEEILQDAEELMALFGGPKKPPTQQPREQLRDPSKPNQAAGDIDIDKLVEKVFTN